MGPQMVQKEMLEPGNTPLDQLVKDKKIKFFFRVHHGKYTCIYFMYLLCHRVEFTVCVCVCVCVCVQGNVGTRKPTAGPAG